MNCVTTQHSFLSLPCRHIRDKKRVQNKNVNSLPSATAFGDAAQDVKMSQLEAQNNVEASAWTSNVDHDSCKHLRTAQMITSCTHSYVSA